MGNLDKVASATTLGMIKIGTGLSVDADGVMSTPAIPVGVLAVEAYKDAANPTLTNGTVVVTSTGANHTATLGSQVIGAVATFINWHATALVISCPTGTFMDGTNSVVTSVSVPQNAQVTFTCATSYWFGYRETPAVATYSTVGTVKVGAGLSVAADGTLSSTGDATVTDSLATSVDLKGGVTLSVGSSAPPATTLLRVPTGIAQGSEIWVVNDLNSNATVSFQSGVTMRKFGSATNYAATDTILIPPGSQWRAVTTGNNLFYEIMPVQPVANPVPATSSVAGLVKVGGGLSVTADGTLSATPLAPLVLHNEDTVNTPTANNVYTVCTVTLTPGTWLVTGGLSVTNGVALLATNASATFATTGSIVDGPFTTAATVGSLSSGCLSVVPQYFTVSVNTDVNLKASSSLALASGNFSGQMSAVRLFM